MYAGLGMSAGDMAARYREYAADCIKVAAGLSETVSKMRLLDMAKAWLDLADQAEKNGETVIFYQTPVSPRPGEH